jgi:hypothetical protein
VSLSGTKHGWAQAHVLQLLVHVQLLRRKPQATCKGAKRDRQHLCSSYHSMRPGMGAECEREKCKAMEHE